MGTRRLVAVGECMGELRPRGDGALDLGFAGDTFNAAWYARRHLPPDWDVGYVTAFGDDPLSDRMAAFMAQEGIDARGARRIAGAACGLYLITTQEGERRFTYWRQGSAARRLADDAAALADGLAGAGAVHVSGITLAILPPAGRDRLLAALAQARGAGAVVSFDTNLRPALWESLGALRDWTIRAAAGADVVLPSLDEEQAQFGDRDAASVAARYARAGAALVVVKDGAGPVTLADGSDCIAVPPGPTIAPVDTTAAGDAFAGAFLAAHLIGAAPEAAVRAGQAVAARVVAAPGALVADS